MGAASLALLGTGGLALGTLAVLPADAAAPNLLTEPQSSFESSPTGWTGDAATFASRTPRRASDGRYALSLVGWNFSGRRALGVSTPTGTAAMPVTPGSTYTASYDARARWAADETACEIVWYGADGRRVGSDTGAWTRDSAFRWTGATCEGTAPADAARASLSITFQSARRGEVHFVDDVSFVRSRTGSGPAETSTTVAPTTAPPTTTAPTTAPPTSAPPTTAPPTTTTPPTTAPPPTTVPPSSGATPTASNTGPRVANPQNVGTVHVTGTQTLTDVVADSIVVHAGGQLTATNVRVNGSVVVLPQVGGGTTKLHMAGSAVHAGMTINVVDSGGNLYWGGEVPVDVSVSNSWVHHPQGDGQYHTEALAGFGWPRGARFTNTAFIQAGPFNATATATINWHGADTVLDRCYFGWSSGVAAYYTVYVEGRNNVVKSSSLQKGMASFVYPDSAPKATYSGNTDATNGAPLNL